jgi:hypothetical protein
MLGLLSAGCRGHSTKLIPVSGNVTLSGTSLPMGAVTFIPEAGKGNDNRRAAKGTIDAQGRYNLTTGGEIGAAPGKYKVAVFLDTPGGATPPKGLLINPKYSDPNNTDLSVEVVESAPAGAYDLKLSP